MTSFKEIGKLSNRLDFELHSISGCDSSDYPVCGILTNL